MENQIEGIEVSGPTYAYFSLWMDGGRLTGASRLWKVFNYGVITGEDKLTGNALMLTFKPLIKWSED